MVWVISWLCNSQCGHRITFNDCFQVNFYKLCVSGMLKSGTAQKQPQPRSSPKLFCIGCRIKSATHGASAKNLGLASVCHFVEGAFDQGRANHEVHIVNWNTLVLEVENAKFTVCTSRFSPSLIHGLCTIFLLPLTHGFCGVFRPLLAPVSTAPLLCWPLSSRFALHGLRTFDLRWHPLWP